MASKPAKRPPPLPPRQSTQDSSSAVYPDAPPPYEALTNAADHGPWTHSDPRRSSMQSLVPSESDERNERRKLLLIYVHGFMGDETSFRSFPAHVHRLLTTLLAETHVVHTKIYPRYRSKRNISFARDAFSEWLEPHEDPQTDLVLLGHSMGGLLSAEVVLVAPPPPSSRPLKHRILGTINFDVPFLGMHPGIIRSGLASIFKPSEETHEDKYSPVTSPIEGGPAAGPSTSQSPASPSSQHDPFWQPSPHDPYYNTPYGNDVKLPVRKGWSNVLHFVNKHSDNFGELTKATKKLVSSHMEFGGAMANFTELKTRYGRVRALEERDENVRKSIIPNGQVPARVRFVNYYTASTGKIKRENPPSPQDVTPASENATGASLAAPSVHTRENVVSEDEPGKHSVDKAMLDRSASTLPPIPDLPTKPADLDVSYIEDKDTRKLVEKEHTRAIKAYDKAVKDREKIIRDRAKLEDKRKRKGEKDAEKAVKDAEKAKKDAKKKQKDDGKALQRELTQQEKEEARLEDEKQRMEKEGRRVRGEPEPESSHQPKRAVETSSSEDALRSVDNDIRDEELSRQPTATGTMSESRSLTESTTNRPLKDRKFCVLPPKDSSGERDPCWVRVFMEDVDEVGAHCGLFFVDERYERLVGDVAERVEGWVQEAHGWPLASTGFEKR